MAEACASEICVCVTDSLLKLMPGIHVCHDALHGDCMADVLPQESLPLQMRLFRHAGLRCAMLSCAVPCRAVLCSAVLCSVKFDCTQGDDKIKQASGHSAHAHLDVPCRIINRCTLPKGNT